MSNEKMKPADLRVRAKIGGENLRIDAVIEIHYTACDLTLSTKYKDILNTDSGLTIPPTALSSRTAKEVEAVIISEFWKRAAAACEKSQSFVEKHLY